jgi:hypothetical protein
MPSLTAKDRVSLCLFSFTDGRRCRTPRTGNHPHFYFYHAQKEAHAQAAEKLSKDLATFFSGDYLSACDLSTALARLIPAVIRGDIKPRLARTVAYMFQTQLQAIHLSQHEYINAFGTDGWRKAVRTSVNVNYDYRFPPNREPAEAKSAAEQPAPLQSAAPPPQPSPSARACHPERSEGPRPNPTTPTIAETHHPTTQAHPANPAPAQPATPTQPPAQPRPPAPRRSTTPNRDPYAAHFDHTHRLLIDGKPW